MWADINGKTGITGLHGLSGKTYYNVKLLEPSELTAMLADGIAEYTPPAKPVPTPEQLETVRKRQIRSATLERVKYSVLGELDDGEERLASTLIDLILAVATMSQDLVTKGLITGAEYGTRVQEIRQTAVAMRNARQAAQDAIINGDDLSTFNTALDLIITPPPSEII